jgi:hypothetical protein
MAMHMVMYTATIIFQPAFSADFHGEQQALSGLP